MQREYRLLTYRGTDGKPTAGVLVDQTVYPLKSLLSSQLNLDDWSVLGALQRWSEVQPKLRAAAEKTDGKGGMPLASVTLMAPILYPSALFCAGANYWDHLEEMAELAKKMTGKAPSMVKPAEPWLFVKTAAHSIVATNTDVPLPSFSKQMDWEAELGVVIGKTVRNLPAERYKEAIAGFVIVNDLSARDYVKREGSIFVYDWIGQKCFDGAAPMGPWITPLEFVPDPNDMPIKLTVNGVVKQQSNSGKMVHSIAEQIAYLSSRMTLRPGDVIATGTPAGVGFGRGEFLKPGDVIRIEIANCGILENRMVAEAATAGGGSTKHAALA
ncbi:MAG: fumarylacetoacetate hydrolase family protein [Alphaproteobacteria bacterium]